MKIAGLDIGTTGCKLTVFDERGTSLDKAYCDYPVSRKLGVHEIDAFGILRGVDTVIKKMAFRYPDIAGIGVTSFGETFVLTDEEGMPLYPAMLYTDPRGAQECQELRQKLGEKAIVEITGVNPHEMYSISKMMWLKTHEPELFARGSHLFLIEDFVVFHLTGNAQIDYSLASRTMAFDIRTLKWSEEILTAADISSRLLSRTVPTGTSAGTVTPKTAKETGLSRDTVIVNISHDQIAAAVGAGVFDSDIAVEGAGTVECITPVYDSLPDIQVMSRGNYAVVPYVIPGKYVCYAFSYTGGALIQWCVDTLAGKEKEEALHAGISVNEYLEKQAESPTGLLVLPHFAGAATPYMDTGSKGAVLGLTAGTTLAEIYRACMEGVCYEMLTNMEYLKLSGVHFQTLYATGGGTKSEEWTQMKADMLNCPIVSLETVDAGTVGSAMLTGIVVGCFRDLKDAADKMVVKNKTFYPRTEMYVKYRKIYDRYRRVYEAVRPLVDG